MTLVIAAPGKTPENKNFIILGADSRGVIQDVAGNRIETNVMKKLIPVANHVGILMYGNADIGNQLVEKFKSTIKKGTDGATKIAEEFANFCRSEFKKLSGVPLVSLPHLGFIVAGLNKEENKYNTPCLYTLRSTEGFALGMCKPYAIEGKPIIALYIFAKEYKEEMNVPDLTHLVAQAIYDTMRIDGDVGGKIKMAIIDSNGLREYEDSDIEKFYKKWEIIELEKIISQ